MTESTSIKDLSVKEFFNTFSLLVVIGSVSTAYFFARIFHASPGYGFYHLLGTTVWAIYTTDHILDGLRNKDSSLALRHRVHVRYRHILIALVVLIVISNQFLASKLPLQVLQYGIGLTAFVFLYLMVVHVLTKQGKFVGKEIAIAMGVTGGMALLPALYGNFSWTMSNGLLLVIFTFLNLTNLLIFSYFDRDHDRKSGFGSLVQVLGTETVKKIINSLLAVVFVLICVWSFTVEHDVKIYIAIIFLFMMHVLALIMLREDEFVKHEGYRFWGDFIYLIPGLFWGLMVEQII